MLKIGLTGGIATGKSIVSDWLIRHRFAVIDADQIARDVVEPEGEGLHRVAAAFGDGVLNAEGRLDRRALGEIVFHNGEKRRLLNGLLHPLIRERMNAEAQRSEREGTPVIFFDIPLLFEGGLDRQMDRTIVVATTKETQISRLMKRNHLSRAEALSRIDAQMPLDEKKKRADAVVDNNGTIAETEAQVVALMKKWRLLG
ncbi:MAG: dephospho-CoA kinase [Sporolactobacillus sp.]|jgi:dephospho-CoA kinase|nr:dephospho-CoA kinase [Sporolactobacillus sp.]